MITKQLKCEACGFVKATNRLDDDRFYCPGCGKNLGVYLIKEKRFKEDELENVDDEDVDYVEEVEK
jgi:Zn finger protein HypA/HybF involved in hydrogenase expression